MLQIFNPNLNTASRPLKQMSWKTLSKQNIDDYVKVVLSKYDAYRSNVKNAKGATLAAVISGTENNEDPEIFSFTTPLMEVAFQHVNGNFPLDDKGEFSTNTRHGGNFPSKTVISTKRGITLKVGKIGDYLKEYLISEGMSEAGVAKMEKNQLEWKEWYEGVVTHMVEKGCNFAIGKTRKETEKWVKENLVVEGVLKSLLSNTSKNDKLDNVVYGVPGKTLKFRKSEEYDSFFSLEAKSYAFNKGYPVYPILMDHRDRDMEPTNMVPSQDTLDKIFVRENLFVQDKDTGEMRDTGKAKDFHYHQFDAEGNNLDPDFFKRGDLVKLVFRAKFYKGQSGIGINHEIKEIHLVKRRPLRAANDDNAPKRKAESQLTKEDTLAELDAYF